MRTPWVRFVHVLQAALKPGHQRFDEAARVVGRSIVHDDDTHIEPLRALGDQQALERSCEQRSAVVRRNHDVELHGVQCDQGRAAAPIMACWGAIGCEAGASSSMTAYSS